MKTTREIQRAVLDALEAKGESRYWLSKTTGVSMNTVYGCLSRDSDMSLDTLRRFMVALRIPGSAVTVGGKAIAAPRRPVLRIAPQE